MSLLIFASSLLRNLAGTGAGRKTKSFAKNERGTVTVESVIILPLLFFGLQAVHTYFDSYRHQSLALKANYAVADFLSRKHKYDRSTLEGMDELFEYMSRSDETSWVRVTVVQCREVPAQCNDATPRILTMDTNGSQVSNDVDKIVHTPTTIQQHLAQHIPKMYDGEDLIVVETVAKYNPPFAGFWTGIAPRDFVNISVTSPREYDTLCFDTSSDPCPDPVTD